jgi:hypothetical protein
MHGRGSGKTADAATHRGRVNDDPCANLPLRCPHEASPPENLVHTTARRGFPSF